MNILAIDIGTYSIKFIELKPERKALLLVDKNEIVLEEVKPHYPNITSNKDLQREIVANYIHKKPNDTKIIFQIPNEYITTRYMEIPGSSKRKTEQIIPFQLDENLPYSLSQAHFSSRLTKKSSGFSVISNITQLSVFKDYLSFFEARDAEPSTLTSEISTIQSYIEHVRLNDSCCILDIGHKTTKAYFIQDRKVVANHTSYIAGAGINEVIAKTYQISIEDAILYKHENAFFLSDDQFQNVRPEQKEFALLMRQLFHPLLLEFKRWDIGHRVKYGNSIDKIYLMGGTGQINGIEHFIEFHTGIKVHNLEPIVDIRNDYSLHEKSMFLVKMMAISEKNPSSLINFLTGKFQTSSNSIIPIHSAVFIWVRSSFIALMLFLGLLTERFIVLNNNEKVIDQKISSTLKQNSQLGLDIPKNIQKDFKNNPQNLLKALNKKNKIIKDEVNSILSSNTINALKPLASLSRTISKNPKVNLINFNSDGNTIKARFESSEVSELAAMEKHLKGSGLFDLETRLNSEKKELNITFSDRE
jgi:Tfp pilus assembly PilM family ATPase